MHTKNFGTIIALHNIMKLRTVYLAAGHGGTDPGACWYGHAESNLTLRLRDKVTKNLRDKGVKVINEDNSFALKATVNFWRKLVTPKCIAIEIHFNAFGETSTGTETLVPNKPTFFEVDLARSLSADVSSIMNITTRGYYYGFKGVAFTGVKRPIDVGRKNLFWMSLAAETVLPEVCFMSNREELNKYLSCEDAIADAWADTIYKFCKM